MRRLGRAVGAGGRLVVWARRGWRRDFYLLAGDEQNGMYFKAKV